VMVYVCVLCVCVLQQLSEVVKLETAGATHNI
jgi:hypothetical protein